MLSPRVKQAAEVLIHAIKRYCPSAEIREENGTGYDTSFDFINFARLSNCNNVLLDILGDYRDIFAAFPRLWDHNINTMNDLIRYKDLELLLCIDSSIEYEIDDVVNNINGGNQGEQGTPSIYGSTEQVLYHMKRDWGKDGKDIRRNLYGRILDRLNETGGNHRRVLVPGAAMGRLAMEIAALGYRYY